MNGAVKTTENKALNNLVRRTVLEALQEILADPDYGLALRQDFVRRLRKSIRSKEKGHVISFDKVLRQYQR